MRNNQTRNSQVDYDMLALLLAGVRKDYALAVSARLETLAVHITKKGMNGKDAAELLRLEAIRFEHEAQELQ